MHGGVENDGFDLKHHLLHFCVRRLADEQIRDRYVSHDVFRDAFRDVFGGVFHDVSRDVFHDAFPGADYLFARSPFV